ncbi:MAG: HmuY family protein [Myxococcota bacterium]
MIERLFLLTVLAVPACGDDGGNADAGDDSDTSETTPSPGSSGTPPGMTSGQSTGDETPTPDPDTTAGNNSDDNPTTGTPADNCNDQMILDLGLVDGTISSGDATNAADGDDWVSTVDATAGGIVEAPNNPWIYLRFTAEGLEKVDIDDIQALDSTDWDIAAKRFGIRLNGGVGGPSTVSAAILDGSTYEEITALPDDAMMASDEFYDADCNLIDDGTGQGAPNYRLTPWWTYPGCVATTFVPFVLELADGSHVKLVIEAYYQAGQDGCNDNGMMGMGSANFSWRWAFLE